MGGNTWIGNDLCMARLKDRNGKIGIYCPIMQYIYYIICRYLLYENTGEDIIKKNRGWISRDFPNETMVTRIGQ